jgi:adenylate kinase
LKTEIRSGTALGAQVEKLVNNQQPVPSRFLAGIILQRLHGLGCARGFLLDGFPSTVEEAVLLDGVLAELGRSLERVLLFNIADDVILNRMQGAGGSAGSREYEKSRSWPIGVGPVSPEESLRGRLEVYRRNVVPVVELYRRRNLLVEVDASLSVEMVRQAVMETVGAPVGA